MIDPFTYDLIKIYRFQGRILAYYPLAKQGARLSEETLTASKRRTVGQWDFQGVYEILPWPRGAGYEVLGLKFSDKKYRSRTNT